MGTRGAVSYTHLDVYKRQGFYGALEEDDWRQVIDERLALAEEAA